MSYKWQRDANFYYRPEKIKSDGVKYRSAELETSDYGTETIEWVEANHLRGILKQLVGKDIQVNKGTPERKQGILLSVQHDHLTLLTDDKTVSYVNLHHVKSVNQLLQSDSNKDDKENKGDREDKDDSNKNHKDHKEDGDKENKRG